MHRKETGVAWRQELHGEELEMRRADRRSAEKDRKSMEMGEKNSAKGK